MTERAGAKRLRVYACWEKARSEYPDDPEMRKARYVELMREHGHLIPGEPQPLPCGWKPERQPR